MTMMDKVMRMVSQIEENDEIMKVIHELEKKFNLKAKKVTQSKKLKWKGKPEQFGFIFLELAKNGYIEIPANNGEASYSKYAKTCFDIFDFESDTTLENLKRAMNPDKNRLSETNRKKFSIPSKDDIS